MYSKRISRPTEKAQALADIATTVNHPKLHTPRTKQPNGVTSNAASTPGRRTTIHAEEENALSEPDGSTATKKRVRVNSNTKEVETAPIKRTVGRSTKKLKHAASADIDENSDVELGMCLLMMC